MREYELTLILRPTLSDESARGTTEKVEGWITSSGGEILSVTPVGRKRLAYPIDHQREGTYTVMQFRTRPDAVADIERNLKLSEDVLRYMVVRH